MNKTILIIIVILVVVMAGYFLLKEVYQAPAPEEITPTPKEEVTDPTVREFTVSSAGYRFSPSSITVLTGDKVKITFRNDGRIGHNFVVKDLGISTKTIGSGQVDTVEFTAPAPGTYTFICSVPGHATAGMIGDLVVE